MRAKNKNSASEDNFSALSNLIADPVVIIDGTGKLLAANQGVKEAIGFDPAELVGKSFLEVNFLIKKTRYFWQRAPCNCQRQPHIRHSRERNIGLCIFCLLFRGRASSELKSRRVRVLVSNSDILGLARLCDSQPR